MERERGTWIRPTWPGGATSSKGSHGWGIEQRSGGSAQFRRAAYKYYN